MPAGVYERKPENIAKWVKAMREVVKRPRRKSKHRDRMMNILEDIWRYVDRRGKKECWNWMRGINKTGYGSVRINGIKVTAHRVAYLLSFGGIELKASTDKKAHAFVLHHCDNRLCCNPAHLFLGTYNDNVQDMKKKGRARGGHNGGRRARQ